MENNSRKSEEMEPKAKQHPGVAVTGDGVKSDVVKNMVDTVLYSRSSSETVLFSLSSGLSPYS